MQETVIAFVKFYEDIRYAEKFLNEGEMFCNTLQYFIDLERIHGDSDRGDEFEGTSHIIQQENLDLNIKLHIHSFDGEKITKVITEKDIVSPMYIQPIVKNYNIFCMYAMKGLLSNGEHYALNKGMPELGEYAIGIYNMEEFIRRVVKAAKDSMLDVLGNFINYYDDENETKIFNDKERIFSKRKKYNDSNQSEYRFVFFSGKSNQEPMYLRIGSIEDIACLIDLK